MFIYTIQPVVKPVDKPVWQPVVSCIQTFNRLSNPFDNQFDKRLYRVYSQLSLLMIRRQWVREDDTWRDVWPRQCSESAPRECCVLYIPGRTSALALVDIRSTPSRPDDTLTVSKPCDITQMMHGGKCNIQICCPEVDMSSRGRSPSDDISTEGQHIWMFHEQACFICFVVWPTTSKYKIPTNNIFTFYLSKFEISNNKSKQQQYRILFYLDRGFS